MRHFGAIPDENPSLSDKNPFIGRSLCDRVSMKGLSMADDILLLGLPVVWCGSSKRGWQLRCRSRHMIAVQNYESRPKIALVLLQNVVGLQIINRGGRMQFSSYLLSLRNDAGSSSVHPDRLIFSRYFIQRRQETDCGHQVCWNSSTSNKRTSTLESDDEWDLLFLLSASR
ncbi:hypothetical protein AVEN_107868-1 [Araneus ventricosus]|uniref:Uncharacterized protein n=1 Tax=Araneus ventricosus TaxID=182803 RepID=A0A4Y2R546_ARAVE|nr:hypothetical protein AVEN_107868-1 [Araneus ventricosus]